MSSTNEAVFRAIADCGVLVQFGQTISDEVHARVLQLDAALRGHSFKGFTESVPTYNSLFVGYDPLQSDSQTVTNHLQSILQSSSVVHAKKRTHEVEACYDEPFGRDLKLVAEQSGLTPEQVISLHLAGRYRVFMYGFAPGYAYLGGVSEAIRLPRKTSPIRDVPKGSILIAGQQCLVTTLDMPSGWWIIGRSPTQILRPQDSMPFLFEVGDSVTFRRISPLDL